MRAEKVVSALLNASTDVVSIVGAKIFGGRAPKATKAPLVVYAKQSAVRAPYLDATQSVVDAVVDVMVVTADYPQLKALGEAVRVAVSFQSGTIAGVECVETLAPEEGPDEFDFELEEFAQLWTFTVKHVE